MATKKIDLTGLSQEELIKLVEEKDVLISEKDSELIVKDRKIAEQALVLSGKNDELDTYEKLVSELKEDLASKENQVQTIGGTPTVKVGKETYAIEIQAFTYKGEKYTAADIISNEKLAAELVKIESGVLRKIEK